jgi:hypothetical protein
MAKYLADTTALFEYHAGTGKTRSAARSVLNPRADVVTSEHVVREWKRIIFASVTALIDAMDSEPDLSAAMAKLGIGYGRQASQRWRAAALVCTDTESIDRTAAKLRGRQLLRGDAMVRLESVVAEVRDASGCGLAKQEPQLRDGAWTMKTTCKRREGICDHEARVGRDFTRWSAGAHALTQSADDGLRKTGKTALEMANSPEVRTGVNCYGRTGDLAIATDCRPDETVVTTDHSFTELSAAMGFKVHLIRP